MIEPSDQNPVTFKFLVGLEDNLDGAKYDIFTLKRLALLRPKNAKKLRLGRGGDLNQFCAVHRAIERQDVPFRLENFVAVVLVAENQRRTDYPALRIRKGRFVRPPFQVRVER